MQNTESQDTHSHHTSLHTLLVSCVSIMKLCTCFSALVSSSFLATTATTSAVQPAPCCTKTWSKKHCTFCEKETENAAKVRLAWFHLNPYGNTQSPEAIKKPVNIFLKRHGSQLTLSVRLKCTDKKQTNKKTKRMSSITKKMYRC